MCLHKTIGSPVKELLNRKKWRYLSVVMSAIALSACQGESSKPILKGNDAGSATEVNIEKTIEPLYSFESESLGNEINLVHGSALLVKQGATNGQKALNVKFQSSVNKYADISFTPEKPWNWSQYSDFSLAFDIANTGEVSTQIYLDIEDIDGANYTRAISIPVGPSETYYAKMNGHDLGTPDGDINVELNFASGLRSNPATWESDSRQFVSLWGKKNLNLGGIRKIRLSVQSALRDKEITVDNIRLISNPAKNPDFLTGIVDEYGQNAKDEFPGKIHSDQELISQRDTELAELNDGEMISDRSRFSGWKNGPKLKATGNFRTEKVDGKWYLVDPEGYLYFATGLDIIRLANSSTMTGYDFDHNLVHQRNADDLTPEDSMGLNPVSDEALPSRRKVSAVRADMFNWLPDYDAPLGNHYGYRREAHSGPLDRGETFSFYSANLERKYGEKSPQSYLETWEKVSIDRMRNWGFTSLGNWADPRFYEQERIPFFANGWIIGDFKTVSSGNDFWSPLPDPFDPLFEERALATLKQVAEEVKDSPWCVGVFVDNEKSFGRPETNESRLGIVIHTLGRDGADVPTKSIFTKLMRERYGSIDALNQAWQKELESWDDFNKGMDSSLQTDQQIKDYSSLLNAYARQYFAVVDSAMKTHLPNHLYLGSRFPDWGMPIEVVSAAAEYVDILSFNSYKEGLPSKTWAFLSELDKPSIIGEFHFGASDSGLYHPGLIHAANQEDRARMYKEYMHSVIDNPYFVGAHWFQYIDSPITGRAYDGENYNVGFVSVADIPYAPMVEAAKSLHESMYPRRSQKAD